MPSFLVDWAWWKLTTGIFRVRASVANDIRRNQCKVIRLVNLAGMLAAVGVSGRLSVTYGRNVKRLVGFPVTYGRNVKPLLSVWYKRQLGGTNGNVLVSWSPANKNGKNVVALFASRYD